MAIYEIQSPKGNIYEIEWDKPIDPTNADIDSIFAEIEPLGGVKPIPAPMPISAPVLEPIKPEPVIPPTEERLVPEITFPGARITPEKTEILEGPPALEVPKISKPEISITKSIEVGAKDLGSSWMDFAATELASGELGKIKSVEERMVKERELEERLIGTGYEKFAEFTKMAKKITDVLAMKEPDKEKLEQLRIRQKGYEKSAEAFRNFAKKIDETVSEEDRKIAGNAQEYITNKENWNIKNAPTLVHAMLASTGETLPMSLISMLPYVGQISMIASEGGRWSKEFREKIGDVDPEILAKYQKIYGVPSGLIETYMNRLILGGAKKVGLANLGIVKTFASKATDAAYKKIGKGALKMIGSGFGEGIEEVTQGNWGQAVNAFTIGEMARSLEQQGKTEEAEALRKRGREIAEQRGFSDNFKEFLLGAVAGTFLGAGGMIARKGVEKIREKEVITPERAPIVEAPPKEEIVKIEGEKYKVLPAVEGEMPKLEKVVEEITPVTEAEEITVEEKALREIEEVPEEELISKEVPTEEEVTAEEERRIPVIFEGMTKEESEAILSKLEPKERARLEEAERAIQTKTYTDQLTKVLNRAGAEKRGHMIAEITVDKETGEEIIDYSFEDKPIAMFDIDFFKKVNDEHGHKVGDKVLAQYGRVLNKHLSKYGDVVRYGGEEFALAGLDKSQKKAILDSIEDARREFFSKTFDEGKLKNVNFSAGLSLVNPVDADQQLYKAKEAGRGRTFIGGKAHGKIKVKRDVEQAEPVPEPERKEVKETLPSKAKIYGTAPDIKPQEVGDNARPIIWSKETKAWIEKPKLKRMKAQALETAAITKQMFIEGRDADEAGLEQTTAKKLIEKFPDRKFTVGGVEHTFRVKGNKIEIRPDNAPVYDIELNATVFTDAVKPAEEEPLPFAKKALAVPPAKPVAPKRPPVEPILPQEPAKTLKQAQELIEQKFSTQAEKITTVAGARYMVIDKQNKRKWIKFEPGQLATTSTTPDRKHTYMFISDKATAEDVGGFIVHEMSHLGSDKVLSYKPKIKSKIDALYEQDKKTEYVAELRQRYSLELGKIKDTTKREQYLKNEWIAERMREFGQKAGLTEADRTMSKKVWNAIREFLIKIGVKGSQIDRVMGQMVKEMQKGKGKGKAKIKLDKTTKFLISPEVAKRLKMPTILPTSEEFKLSVEGTPSAQITDDGLRIKLVRYQNPDQAQMTSIRTGVFYLPASDKNVKYYKSGKYGYGGTEKIEGETIFKKPLFVKGATGGKAPEKAYDSIKGKGAYNKMRSDVLGNVMGINIRTSDKIANTEKLLEKYGSDPNIADEIVYISKTGNSLPYAIQENIVAHAVRDAGFDSVVGYSKRRDGTHFISEVFDVREEAYPDDEGYYKLHPKFEVEEEDIKFAEKQKEGVIEKAIEYFGLTDNYLEAGYMLPDGKLLDFSGRHEAVGYEKGKPKRGERDYLAGQRSVDHREVQDIVDESEWKAVEKFIDKTGAIRMTAVSDHLMVSLQTTQEPTRIQWKLIKDVQTATGSRTITYEIIGEKGYTVEDGDARTVGEIRRALSKAKGEAPVFARKPIEKSTINRIENKLTPLMDEFIELKKYDISESKISEMESEEEAKEAFKNKEKFDKFYRNWEEKTTKIINNEMKDADVEDYSVYYSGAYRPSESVYLTVWDKDGDSFTYRFSRHGKVGWQLGEFEEAPVFARKPIAPIWYSKLTKTVSDFKQPKASPAQWIAMIKKAGIKGEELEETGIIEWLEKQEDTITKEDLLTEVQSKEIRIEEVEKGISIPSFGEEAFVEELENQLSEEVNDADFDDGSYWYESIEELRSDLLEEIKLTKKDIGEKKNKYGDIVDFVSFEYEGKTKEFEKEIYDGDDILEAFELDDKDIIFNMIDESVIEEAQADVVANADFSEQIENARFEFEIKTEEEKKVLTKFASYQLPGGENYKELLLTLPEKETAQFKSPHFKEPNVIAHVRFNERTTPDGGKVLFIEEIQSDWHQAGRKRGYVTGANQRYQEERKRIEEKYGTVVIGNLLTEAERKKLSDLLDVAVKKEGDVPDAPFKKTWADLTLKRMMRYAAENDFDRIAWATGEQQADRYDLSKQLSKVKARKRPDGDYNIGAYDKNKKLIISKKYTADQLSNVIGKDLANKIIADAVEDKDVEYSGLDLKVGGEGMKTFYDRMLPNIANKLIKKYGSMVDEVKLKIVGKQPSFPITPEMRESVIEKGVPMFARKPVTKAEVQKAEKKPKQLDIFVEIEDRYKPEYQFKMKAEMVRAKKADPKLSDEKAFEMAKMVVDTEYAKKKSRIKEDRIYEEILKKPQKIVKPKNLMKETSKLFDVVFVPISTRLKRINPKLKEAIRRFEYNTKTTEQKYLARVKDFLDKKEKLMSKEDWTVFDVAEKNRDILKIDELLTKYDLKEEYAEKRVVLEEINQEAVNAGFEFGYLDNFAPRNVVNKEGLLEYFTGKKYRSVLLEAVKQRQAQLEVNRPLTTDEMTEVINNMLRGYGEGKLKLAKPSALKERKIELIDENINKFYDTSDAALLKYIHTLTDAIQSRSFFGRTLQQKEGKVDLENTIGAYTAELLMKGHIEVQQEKELQEMLKARFNPKGVGAPMSLFRDIQYTATMGSPASALTQVQDLGFSIHHSGIFNTLKALAKKNKVSLEDVGSEIIAQEFANPSKSSKVVNAVFKTVGLTKMDRIGKQTLINSALMKYEKQAKKQPEKLIKKLAPIFGRETRQTFNDIKAGKVTDNVKYLLFNDLLDYQPVALSELPQGYMTSGNFRILYMLKTFTLKQIDVYRNQVYDEFRTGSKKQALKNMASLTGSLMAMGMAADALKDLIMGRKIYLEDLVVDNILKLIGFSKFIIWQVREEGLGEAAIKLVAPPHKILRSVSKDIDRLISGELESAYDLEIINSIPVAGKLFYWWFGRGSQKVIARHEKKQWENLTDLRKIKNKIEREKKKEHTIKRGVKIRKLETKYARELNFLTRAEQLKKQYNVLKKQLEATKNKKIIQKIEKEMTWNALRFENEYESMQKHKED